MLAPNLKPFTDLLGVDAATAQDAPFSSRLPKRAQAAKISVLTGSDITLIALTINGEARRFEQPLNCRQLLDQLHLAGKRVALERNGEIVPRSRHGEQMLGDGDKLEIVVAVGGG